jgi:hypothetical protein
LGRKKIAPIFQKKNRIEKKLEKRREKFFFLFCFKNRTKRKKKKLE